MKKHDDLEAACATFKTHLATQVALELQSPAFRNGISRGLKGLTNLKFSDLIKLQQIAQQQSIAESDIDHVITQIVRRDSPAEFAKNYEKFSDALEKYRAVSDMLAHAGDPVKFRQSYDHHKSIILKAADSATAKFFQCDQNNICQFLQSRSFIQDSKRA